MPRRTCFYLDKRNAKFLGVCAGISDYTGIDRTWVRVGAVALVLLGHAFTVVAYLVTAWVAHDKPVDYYEGDKEEQRFWQSVRARPGASVRDLNSSFRDIDRRLADVETYVTSSNRRLADEIEALR